MASILFAELQEPHPLEKGMGANTSHVLVLRMLYTSVDKSENPYERFLENMDPSLGISIRPFGCAVLLATSWGH